MWEMTLRNLIQGRQHAMVKPTRQAMAHHYKAAMAVRRMRTMAVVVGCWPWRQWEADLPLPDHPRGVRLSEENSGKSAETARVSKARRVESKRAVRQILWFHAFAIFPAVVVAMSVVVCVANAR